MRPCDSTKAICAPSNTSPTLLPRSAIIISDEPLHRETNYRTEFVIALNNQPQGGLITRPRTAPLEASVPRNRDGGFGHYPGSTSDADACFFQIGTLILAGWIKPADALPKDPHLLGWGHVFPVK